MNILLYLLIIIMGAIIGFKDLIKPRLMENLGKVQHYSLLFLLVIMGVKIGLDKDTIKSFGLIGLQAILLAVFSIGFSIAAVKLVSPFVMKEKEKEQMKNDI